MQKRANHKEITVNEVVRIMKMCSYLNLLCKNKKERYSGDVGGYFSHENSCRELCANNFGMR